MLVLVAGIVTAYFSRALQERRVTQSSVGGSEADLLAASALDILLTDFVDEMRAGSDAEDDGDFSYFRPLLLEPAGPTSSDSGQMVPLAPSMFAQRTSEEELADLPGIIKISRRQRPFFEGGAGYDPGHGDGPTRASELSTETPSFNGRFIERQTWNLPRLMTDEEFAGLEEDDSGFISPDWIYVDRLGRNPTSGDSDDMAAMASSAPDNDDFVIGRFAYVVYDTGGLIDINVAGNLLEEEENFHRGRLHQVDLSGGIGEVPMPGFAGFVGGWRWADSADDEEKLFDPTRSFLEVDNGDQAFVTRTELVRYAESTDSAIPPQALPYLTTFSRSLNAPHWRPDPSLMEDQPPEPDPNELNPDFAGVRFPAEADLTRGSDPEVTVPAGTPVMPRRFPLHKLNMFNDRDPDLAIPASADSLEYYFGLRRVPGAVDTFEYVATTEDGRIARLHEVADDGREPNFFEVLQAVILTGSVGTTMGNTGSTVDWMRDELRNLHVLQIGANIIDQWDSDDIPTTLRFPSGDSTEPWLEIYGTENLPYLHQFALAPYRPAHDRDLLQIWALFDVWNPHLNARTPPEGIGEFRIKPDDELGGELSRLWIYYRLGVSGGSHVSGAVQDHSQYRRDGEPAAALNDGMELDFPVFPGSNGYAEVTTIRGNQFPHRSEEHPTGEGPDHEADRPGLLLWEYNLSENHEAPMRHNPITPSPTSLSGTQTCRPSLTLSTTTSATWRLIMPAIPGSVRTQTVTPARIPAAKGSIPWRPSFGWLPKVARIAHQSTMMATWSPIFHDGGSWRRI